MNLSDPFCNLGMGLHFFVHQGTTNCKARTFDSRTPFTEPKFGFYEHKFQLLGPKTSAFHTNRARVLAVKAPSSTAQPDFQVSTTNNFSYSDQNLQCSMRTKLESS